MNFENYNKIYKEILDDEKEELSSNYLLNKYEIKHDEELLNILHQIKKNEYISSENKIINNLIEELDENEDLLDINEIINIKDKVLDLSSINLNEEIDPEEIIDNKTENKLTNVNVNIKKQNYYLYAIPLVLVLTAAIYLSKDERTEEIIVQKIVKENLVKIEKENSAKTLTQIKKEVKKEIVLKAEKEELPKPIEKEVVAKIEEVREEPVIKSEEEPKELLSDAKIVINKIEDVTPIIIVKKENIEKITSEDKLNKIKNQTEKTTNKDTIVLNSLDEINKYQNALKYKDNKLLFNGKYYEKNNILFGFKIFKITPLYVKFEDVNKKMRKRFLIKK